MTPSDLELLQRFARDRAQDAFTELVYRHLNLVHSAALRQVRSPQLAEDIAQSVFADLARDASKLKPDTVLVVWLHAVTRRTAVDAIRKESRRQLREQLAVEMNAMNAPDATWNDIEPLLDEAVTGLDESDRTAVLLRYFENQSLREVGQQLGVSDDAAQKRVSRAVERLREFFAKRGITVGAGGLVVVISANAVQAAPVGLAVTISAAALAGTAVTTSTLITATTKTIAMTTLQKPIVTAAVAALAGAGIYQARQAAQLRDQVQALQQEQAPLAEQINHLQSERDAATNLLADLRTENSRLKSNFNQAELLKLRDEVTQSRNKADQPAEKILKAWVARKDKLQHWLEQKPEYKIPELALLDDEDWLASVKNSNLETERQFRWVTSGLRGAAESQFGSMLFDALQKYSAANERQFPRDLTQLQSYFNSPVPIEILERWQIASGKQFPGVGDWVITQKSVPDEALDSRTVVGANGRFSSDFLSLTYRDVMTPVYRAFEATNVGQNFADAPDYTRLLPYATTPEQMAAVQKWIDKTSK